MKSKQPLVTVVIPMYNVAFYVKEALHSVIAQTFYDFEVLCINDGSPDNSSDIVNAIDDPRIKVINQRNRGLSGARNTGIYNAKGKYIAFLDADDRWHPNKLEHHVKHLESCPEIGCSYSPSLFINELGKEIGIGQFPKTKQVSTKHIFCRNPVGNGSAPVIRKQTLEDVSFYLGSRKMYFDETLRQSEDIECWTRISLDTPWKFAGIDLAGTYYRVNMDGLSANLNKQLESWQLAMGKLKLRHPAFFAKYYTVALAYQYRYYARRAIQSGNKKSAFVFLTRAFTSHPKILIEEPLRTLNTIGCAILSLLPRRMYISIESTAMRLIATAR